MHNGYKKNSLKLDRIMGSIRNVNNYPKDGILFKDITPLLKDRHIFNDTIDSFYQKYKYSCIDFIVGIEARGFILGGALAIKLNSGFIPIRKINKLPYKTISQKYTSEYGSSELEMHADSFDLDSNKDKKILLVDDVLATGGSMIASLSLMEKLNIKCKEACVILELKSLMGREEISSLKPYVNIFSLARV